MASRNPSSRKTPLQRALRRGMKRGANLEKELWKLGKLTFRTGDEAFDVCEALRRILPKGSTVGGPGARKAVLMLYTDVEQDSPAIEVLREVGVPLVWAALDEGLQDSTDFEPYDLLWALEIVVAFTPTAGVDAVVRAVRKGIAPDEFRWVRVFECFADGCGELEQLFRELSGCLPTSFAAIALLDRANAARRAGAALTHPFDSAAGLEHLERLLRGVDPERYSYAASATMALPFLGGSKRDELLAIALEHPSYDIRLRAARAAADLGRDTGFEALARACLDLRTAERARIHLEELDREDVIPAEAKEADFKARANFAEWLADYRELGVPPDEVEIVDRRELNWPPERKPIPVRLLRYRASHLPSLENANDSRESVKLENEPDSQGGPEVAEDEYAEEAIDKDSDLTTDVGFVGGMTFCMFGYAVGKRPPEDGYAMHCHLEMELSDLISDVFVFAEQDEEEDERNFGYEHLLEQCPIPGIELTRILRVTEFADVLRYPAKQVAIASGIRGGERGWVVLDGPRTRWYARSEVPVAYEALVMMVHIGRVLLGFTDEPDRRKYLTPQPTR